GCLGSSPSWRLSEATLWYTESGETFTPDQTWFSSSSMLTTSPACSVRHKSRSIALASSRRVSPFREISPVAGFTHHAPTRSRVLDGLSMQVLLGSEECWRRLYQHPFQRWVEMTARGSIPAAERRKNTAHGVSRGWQRECK